MCLERYGHTIRDLHVCVRFKYLCFDCRSPTEIAIKAFPDNATQGISSATTAQTNTLRDSRTNNTVPIFIFLDDFVHNWHVARKTHFAIAASLALATYEAVFHGHIITVLVFIVPVMLYSADYTLKLALILDFVRTCFDHSFCLVDCVRI